jgi:hypothetical protein
MLGRWGRPVMSKESKDRPPLIRGSKELRRLTSRALNAEGDEGWSLDEGRDRPKTRRCRGEPERRLTQRGGVRSSPARGTSEFEVDSTRPSPSPSPVSLLGPPPSHTTSSSRSSGIRTVLGGYRAGDGYKAHF